MKKILYLLLFSTLVTTHAKAENTSVLPDSLLVECYGEIRAEMAKAACEIAGFKNDSVIKLIANNSLGNFFKALENNDKVLHKVIKGSCKSIEKMSIQEYDSVLNVIRINLISKMLESYPDKEDAIYTKFANDSKIKSDISVLTAECLCFEESTEEYKKKYSKGRFITLIKEETPKTSASLDSSENKDVKSGNNENEPENEPESEQESDADSASFMDVVNKIVYTIGILAILVVGYRVSRPLIKKYKKRMEEKEKKVGSDEEKESEKSSQSEIGHSNDLENPDNPETEKSPSPTDEKTSEPAEGIGASESPKETAGKIEDKEEKEKTPNTTTPKFSKSEGGWLVVGASVQGNGHISANIPCQDYCAYESLGNGWGIAITSDGAGSAAHSDVGSKATVSRAMHYMKTIIEQEGWMKKNELPTEIRWMKLSVQGLKAVRDDIYKIAAQNKIEPKSLSATVIVIIHSPIGLLVAHIGDGRAGYRDAEGNWNALITPHKGEEANQTIFVPSDFWNIPMYEMSGVMVPEARIVKDKVTAFALMSDGCEGTSWLYNQRDEKTGKFYDPNRPYSKFFDPLIDSLIAAKKKDSVEKLSDRWYSFIKDGNDKFKTETDDKTMILGILEP